jgi:hypothetical protein
MENQSVVFLRSLVVVSVAVGAYLQHSARAITEWFSPSKCETDELAREVRALRLDLSQAVRPSGDTFPCGAVALWTVLLVGLVVVRKADSESLDKGKGLIKINDAAASPARRTGGAPDRREVFVPVLRG